MADNKTRFDSSLTSVEHQMLWIWKPTVGFLVAEQRMIRLLNYRKTEKYESFL